MFICSQLEDVSHLLFLPVDVITGAKLDTTDLGVGYGLLQSIEMLSNGETGRFFLNAWMVTGNGTSGSCGVTSLGGVDQHVSNVAIAMVSHKGGFSENPPSRGILFQGVEVIKQDLLNWPIERVVSKY